MEPEPVGVLVIEEGAEAALVCAALARRPEVRVLESSDAAAALERLAGQPVALAIAGSRVLADSADELVKALAARGIPVVGLAASFAPAARKRALAAGVREIHERPADWPAYAALVDSLVGRFTGTDSAPRPGRTK
jgi:CheY-like chemotaxis protein